jgi:hypothetical protein
MLPVEENTACPDLSGDDADTSATSTPLSNQSSAQVWRIRQGADKLSPIFKIFCLKTKYLIYY